ncbi:DUF2897 family protein [Photobacterium galatheae]|uniref:Succinyl-diaminopimelate desuccinylase n=1 Tax=Photobacterium galatheae TaxID=1654360 RepID=A0A066RRB1_9GAMM|nr:DUF2897 family protein [Photobacterium galatheae]KDM92995.1 succinyl-diaminopimelate desuccinylase [Photobacterium galatheae]MCM0148478.1 DUF2897 family protein [Photobacterium galatheae]
MDWLLNPWVITIIIVSVVVSNIAAIKYTAHMKFGPHDKTSELLKKQQEVENLTRKDRHAETEEKK